MEVATVGSRFFPTGAAAAGLSSPATSRSRVTVLNRALTPSSSSITKSSLSTNLISPQIGGGIGGGSDFGGAKIRPDFIDPSFSPSSSRDKRSVITKAMPVIPFHATSRRKRPAPDLASYLLQNRIVYLGMNLVPAVTELLIAEFLYLNYKRKETPIYFYINSTGTTRGDRKLGYETEALALYDAMSFVRSPIYTLCIGNAWGEASLLLASGKKGRRAALPSTTIMMRQPIGRVRGQVTDMSIMKNEITTVKTMLVEIYAKRIGKTVEQITEDMKRPKYFSPTEAVEYGIIDKVVYNERATKDGGALAELKRAEATRELL